MTVFSDLMTELLELRVSVKSLGERLEALQSTIHDGWKLVPMEPTEEMLRSAFCEAGGSYENTKGIYHAMLAAAPEPSK